MSEFTRASFCLDSIEGTFDGYSEGDTWNGWECPHFEYSEAERVLRGSEKNGFNWSYDQAEDVFFIRNELDADDATAYEVGAEVINVEGRIITTYPIGAYNWIWEYCGA